MAEKRPLTCRQILKKVKQIQSNLQMSNIDDFTSNSRDANIACDYYYKAQNELWALIEELGGSNFSQEPKSKKLRQEQGLK